MNSPRGQPATLSREPRGRQFYLWMVLVAAMVIVACGWFAIAVRSAKEAAIACQCQGHLNQLQLALVNYESVNGHFPPAYVVGKDGKPMHSWRVLILPFIEERSLYESYDFNEPWNGPHNSKLADKMPNIFHMPSEPPSSSMTNIVAIAGPGTAFPGSQSTRKADFTDGLDNTILLTEITDSKINWLEPKDLHVEEMSFTINDKQKPSLSCSRKRGPFVVFGDSIHTHQVSALLQPEALRALTTIAGAEGVHISEIDGGWPRGRAQGSGPERLRIVEINGVGLTSSDTDEEAK